MSFKSWFHKVKAVGAIFGLNSKVDKVGKRVADAAKDSFDHQAQSEASEQDDPAEIAEHALSQAGKAVAQSGGDGDEE